jgi:glyoxylase-like metal-dependent hydrolase (beta-lactamase superfamily II)
MLCRTAARWAKRVSLAWRVGGFRRLTEIVDPEELAAVAPNLRDQPQYFDGFEVSILGSSGQIATADRGSSALTLRTGSGRVLLFDCGESTQVHFMQSHVKLSHVDAIFISHMHADHVQGLYGTFCALNHSRDLSSGEPLLIFGPPGVRSFLRSSIRTTYTRMRSPFQIRELAIPGAALSNYAPDEGVASPEVPSVVIEPDADGVYHLYGDPPLMCYISMSVT